MRTSFKNRVVVITGASSGLGRQLAFDLAKQQAQLVLADQDQSGLAEVASGAKRIFPAVVSRKTDVTVVEECRDLAEYAVKEFGGLDFLILSAGISMWARFEDVSDLAVFRRLIQVNYLGAVHCIHAALPFLKKSRGTIVAISSLQGEIGIPHHTGYSASKHALNGFLEALELELGNQVRILNIMPGWITGTNLRASAFKTGARAGEGGVKAGKASVSVEECSRLILRSMQTEAKRLFIPRRLGGLLWLKALAPGILKRLIGHAVDAQRRN